MENLCRRCKRRPALPGRRQCEKCRLGHERDKQANTRRRQNRLALGLCRYCNNPSVDGIRVCERHARLKRKQQQHTPWGKTHLTGNQLSKWHPNRTAIILNRLWQYEPYLRRDWDTAKPWITQHIHLWGGTFDATLYAAAELSTLQERFNVYLDGAPDALENGIRLHGIFKHGSNAKLRATKEYL